MKGLKTNEPTTTTTISFIYMTITKYYSIAKAT